MEKYSGEGFMKRNIKNFLIKAFSMCLAFILVFPTNLFAMGLDNAKYYKASASIMGLAQTDTTSQNDNEVTDQTLLETEITKKETDKYLIEKYARLSKTTGQIEYMIKVHPKDKKAEDKVTTSFAISKNTDLKDLKIEKINQVHSDKTQTEIKYQEQRPSILYNNDAFETLGVTTDKADLVYYLSAKLLEESLAKIDDRTPTMDLDINIAEAGANTYQDRYALSIEKMDLVDEDGEYTIETLKEKEDAIHQISAIYKEGNTSGEKSGEITWTDFIHADDDKEFTTDIKLDEAQDATDSQIKVEFYQANEKGYTLKEDFTKEIPFTESLKLQIPLGFITKVELKTKASGNAKEYSLNQTKIPNPIYKEEKTEEKSEEDADPLPEESPNTEESKDTSEEKIIPIDPETNEAVIDHSLVKEDTKEESEPAKEETSAINLNRDSVINNFKNDDKLNPVIEITINNISSLFNAYNNDEMTYEEFLANLKTQAKDLSKEDFAEIVKGLIAGLNQETYKVANIDEDQLLAEIYGKDEAEEQATEEKPVTETKESDTKETSNVETDNVETETKEDFRTPEGKVKDDALKSFDETLAQAKENSKNPQKDDRSLIGNLSEGIKGIFGQSNLQKADQELKAALDAGKSLEEIQALLLDLGKKYQLNSKDEAKLMADNEDAIKGLIARDADENFRPSMLMAKNQANPLLLEKIDKNGNPVGSIIEPGRDDVVQIINPDDSNYEVNTDAYANPVIKDGELQGYNWTIKVSSDTDLNELGLNVNLTEVVGSGLKEIENIKIQNSNEPLGNNPIKGAFGIHDSRHHAPEKGIKDITYNFYTGVQGMQEKYIMDISIILTAKGKVGAKRFVMNGLPKDKVKEATPIRSGMNNRTTILGEFTSETAARWTVTDAVSTGDVNKDKNISTSLPLETRSLSTNQTLKQNGGQIAVYKIDPSTGKMVQDGTTKVVSEIPGKGTNPGDNQAVGTIAVYGYDTSFNSTEKKPLSLGGVEISKYQDIHVDQNWNLDKDLKMPAQTIKAVDPSTNAVLGTTGENGVPEQSVQQGAAASRSITIPNVKVWNIQGERKFTKTQPKIVQTFPTDKTYNGQPISYYENHNYYDPNTKGYNIHNRGTVEDVPNRASFTIVKTDKKDSKKKLAGARFKLLGGPEVITDSNGEAVFNNIAPGTYTIFETKAPNGYKSNQENATIYIDKEGRVSLEGGPASISAGANPTQTVEHSGYPDYMNAMQYATKDDKGNVTTYIFLKANEEQRGGSTDRDTRLNLRMDNGSIEKVEVYDVYPDHQRNPLKSAMTHQTADQMVGQLGGSVLNSPHTYPINGSKDVYDQFLQKTGYQISLPKERFTRDWGFLVKVTGTGDSLTYDWLTDGDYNTTNGEAKIQDQKIVPSSSTDTDKTTKITITNEAFETRPVELTKLDKENNPVAGATFVIKYENGDVISTVTSGKDGKVSFGKMPGGKYTIEETEAPTGYVKSNVIFEVTVDDSKQVTYIPKFKNGNGYPVNGEDYFIKDMERGQDDSMAKVTSVEQNLYVNDKEKGSIGRRPGIWEAYFLESLSYTAKIQLENSTPGYRFSIQFDPNLDFTQYFNEFPKIMKDGKAIADPYFDYTTNKLTYVFNDNSKGGPASANIKLVGMIPSKYFAQNDGTYDFTVTVAPGQDSFDNQTITQPIVADYNLYYYDPARSKPSQTYYFRDVYKADDGNWYVTALAYYNPDYVRPGSNDVLNFNWKSVRHYTAGNYVKWKGDGTTPPYDLTDVKVYRTAPDMGIIKLPELQTQKKVNYNMPLSFGVRPEQDPSTYHLIYSRNIDPNQKITNDRNGDVVLNYDPNILNTFGTLEDKGPLNIQMPSVNNNNKDGYIIEQTFKISDINKFNNTWRAFNMANGSFNSAFVSKANANIAIGDQTGGEIPKFYSQEVGLFNKKYEPGKFSILKQDETNSKPLANATFSLTDEDNNVIYRSSGIDGIVNFDNLKPGSYILKEEISPTGFIKTDRSWHVDVSIDGNVTITEIGLNASGETIHGKEIQIPVGNKPKAPEFRVYKKDADNKPLEGAEFKLRKQGQTTAFATGKSEKDGVVKFNKKLTKGTYILEETKSPDGYQTLDSKWVVEVDANNKVKIYTYNEKQSDPSEGTQKFENSLLTQDGVNWVNVSQRPTDKFISGDNRQTGYADKSQTPYKLGTRILGINKTGNYAIQRYVINPEGRNIDIQNALIHREKLWDENMTWYAGKGKGDVKIYTLDNPVTTNVEDIRLYSYNYTDITDKVDKSSLGYSYSNRLQLVFDKNKLKDTDGNSLIKGKPIIVDVKIPYTSEYGGVGTGMDLNTSVGSSWKSDYYELVSDIAVGDPIKKDNITDDIKGSYISDDYLDVTNEKKRYEFSIDKVNQEKNESGGHDAVKGATFKLVGPKPSEETKWAYSDDNGKVSFKDLVPGIYDLTETGPAQGYEKANTNWQVAVLKDGKIYIRENNTNENTGAESTSEEKTAKLLVDGKDVTTSKLEIGDDLVSSPVSAGDGWEAIDPSITTGGSSSKFLAGDNGAPVTTKITEINKNSKKFRQEFVYSPAPYNNGITNRNIQINRYLENYGLTKADTNITVYQNVNGVNKDITSSVSFEESVSLNESESPSKPVKRLVADIPETIEGTLTVKVETKYDPNKGIGLVTNYDSYVGATESNILHNSWLAYSYIRESGINKETTNNTNGYSSTEGSDTASAPSSETDPLDSFTPEDGKDILISDKAKPVQITNKKDGITPKIIKTDSYGNKLEGARFNIKKMTDGSFTKIDDKFTPITGTSDKDGNVTFKDKDGKVVKLKKGHYVMTEEKSPDGYKRITAPWKMEVKDEGGKMSAVYKGPTDTPSSFIDDNKKANAKTYNADGDIKVKSRLTYINPESKTFVQRIYIDTRNYTGGDFLNVQISPKYKREEIDRPGLPPVTIKEGVKTAFRTTYQLVNPGENPDITNGDYDKILRTYDLSDPNMSMVNTARWRPFDWGFDEDQLNIGKGVYIVEVEGYYDDTIINGMATNEVYINKNKYNFTDAQGNPSKEPVKKAPYKKTDAEMNPADYGKIDLHVDFYKGKREFEQLVYSQASKSVYFDTIIGDTGKNTAAYQGGAEALRKYIEATNGKEKADAWAKSKPAGQKYANFISKKITLSNGDYITGKIDPPIANEPYHHADTSVNLNPIYSSDKENEVPKTGLVIENEKEKYNITFSKHGLDNPNDNADSQAVTENRLEGAVFKIQKLIGGNYEDVKGSTVASAFNGYFGFRNLEPGRYRLMEVQAPKGYRPINEPLLYFTVETIRTDSGKIVDPKTGKIIDIKTINVKFPGDDKGQALTSLYMADPKDSTKKIKINEVDSKEINMETIIYKSADATSGKPLKELTLVVSDGHEYALLQTKIISDSSGFVSLEYEGANGVFQYVPEKTTSVKDGKLVDFVTSATAKNMGKIINEKPGKGSITINKKDGEGNALEGAEFKLTRILENGTGTQTVVNYNATSKADGKVEFKDLPIGNYELVETKPADGYQNRGQIWHFTVGGEGLDPYSGPIARTGVDLTNYITLYESEMEIIRPDNDPYKQTENTIWPNSAQLFRFKNDFQLEDGITIRPGDYFQVKLSDYTDLYGIYNKDLVSGLDIYADGVGTIAKAEYDDAREIITYTFTEYARTYELIDFNTSIVSHIDRFKFKTSQSNVPVGFKMNREDAEDTFKKVDVEFDLGTHFAEAYGTRPNLSSKITYFDTKSGEFEHIFYINRDQNLIKDGRFTYLPAKGVGNLRLQVFRVNDNLLNHYNNNWYKNMNYILPPSYAVNVNNLVNEGYIYLLNNNTYYGDVSKDNPAVYTFPNGFLQPEDTYIIRVTGSIKDKNDTADYEAQGKIDRYNYYNQPYMGAERHDYVYGLLNENNAKVKLEITATNPKNEISFKKTDEEGKVLEGAKFALEKYDDTSATWTEVTGTDKTTGKDGLVKYEKLAPGKYALIEKEAPAGYNKIEGHIEEFTVDKDGIITKEVTRPKGSDNPVGSTDGTQPDTPKPGTGTTTPSYAGNVLDKVTEVLGDAIDKVTGKETETVNEPIGSNPINVVNYKNIELVKVDGDDNTKTLQGAVFEIHYKEKEDGDYAALTKKETVDGNEVDKAITVTSGTDGKFKLPISKDGYYALVETKAPEGYGKTPGKIKEFKLESGSLSVLEKDPLKSSLTRGKKGQITSQVLSVDKDKNTFTQRIVINPKHESLTGINDTSYLRILENGWSITPKANTEKGGGQIKVALLKKDSRENDKKSIGELEEKDFKPYNPVEYGITGSNNGSRYSLKELLGNASETTDTIVVEYTGTLADVIKPVDQNAEFIIDNTILDNADYSLDIDTLSSTDPIYVDVNKSNVTPIEVENKKSTYPLTGGNGVFTGFAIIGTAVMLLALAYFGIYQNDKNRRRSARYKK